MKLYIVTYKYSYSLLTDESLFPDSWARVCKPLLWRIVAENVENAESVFSGDSKKVKMQSQKPEAEQCWAFITALMELNLAATNTMFAAIIILIKAVEKSLISLLSYSHCN